jgi:hypothetical protein
MLLSIFSKNFVCTYNYAGSCNTLTSLPIRTQSKKNTRVANVCTLHPRLAPRRQSEACSRTKSDNKRKAADRVGHGNWQR